MDRKQAISQRCVPGAPAAVGIACALTAAAARSPHSRRPRAGSSPSSRPRACSRGADPRCSTTCIPLLRTHTHALRCMYTSPETKLRCGSSRAALTAVIVLAVTRGRHPAARVARGAVHACLVGDRPGRSAEAAPERVVQPTVDRDLQQRVRERLRGGAARRASDRPEHAPGRAGCWRARRSCRGGRHALSVLVARQARLDVTGGERRSCPLSPACV